MIPKIETGGDDAAEGWSTPVNWEEDPAIKAERRRRINYIYFRINYKIRRILTWS